MHGGQVGPRRARAHHRAQLVAHVLRRAARRAARATCPHTQHGVTSRTTTDRLIQFSLVDAILYTCIVIHIKAEDFCHMAEIITHARRQSKRALRYQATVYLASSRVIFEQVTTIREYNLVI